MADLGTRIAQLSPEKRELLEALRRKQRGGVERVVEPDRVPRRRGAERAPLSLGQERLWFIHRMAPGSSAYNIPKRLGLEGPLDAAALSAALSDVVRRHEILRTRYELSGDSPSQVVDRSSRMPLPVVDLSRLPPATSEREAERLAARQADHPFDLSTGPVLRALLVRLAPESHRLSIVVHHVAADGWSMRVLVHDLARFYRVRCGRDRVPEPLPFQYADYAAWQRERLADGREEEQIGYWRDRLGGVEPVLELPWDRPPAAVRTGRGSRERMVIAPAVGRRLRELARHRRATPFLVVLGLVQALLARYSGRLDPVVGSPLARRGTVELEPLIGFFVETVVFRSDLTGDPSFATLLERVRDELLDAQAHQDVPFERLVSELAPDRDPGRSPLFQVAVVVKAPDEAGHGDRALPGLRARELPVVTANVKFDLTFALADTGTGFEGVIEYSADLFDRTTVRRMATHLAGLAAAAADRPDCPVARLSPLPPPERHQLLFEVSGAGAAAGASGTVVELVEGWAGETPDAVAVSWDGGAWSYSELWARSQAAAGSLASQGVGPGGRVAVCLERSAEEIAVCLGVLSSGAAYLPLDPEYPAERIGSIVADSGAEVLVAGRGTEAAAAVGTRSLDPAELLSARAARGRDGARGPVAPEAPAYVIYTSGSTGRPKGVEVPHGSLAALVAWHREAFSVTPGDRATRLAGPAFDASVWETWCSLAAGASLAVPPAVTRNDPAVLAAWLVARRVTVSFLPTPMAEAVLELEWPGDAALSRLLTGGDRLGVRPRPGLPFRVVNDYGPTECTVVATSGPVADAASAAPGRAPTIGRPIRGTTVRVVGPDLRAVPLGVPGELVIGGAGVAHGYSGRPALTAERFVPDPFGPEAGGEPAGGRLYRTGDRARWLPDGRVEFLGRLDRQVKIRGYRIEPGEVRAVLEEHPGVRASAVVARERSGASHLVAYVVADGGTSAEALRGHLAGRLPNYMVPSGFVFLDALPLTPNGKVDRGALPEPSLSRPDLCTPFIAPRDGRERTLAEIWRDVLGVERVGIDDSFFSLGGDSIVSIRVRDRAERAGIVFSLEELFRHPTVRELARAEHASSPGREQECATAPFSLVSPEDRAELPDGLDDAYPVTALQAGMIYHGLLHPERGEYHHVNAVRLTLPFDAAGFRRAVARLAARHPVLRTAFDTASFSEPLQLVHAGVAPPIEVCDLRGLSEPEREAALREELDREIENRFDLGRPPLLRFRLTRLDEESFRVTWAEHHAILDGWSEATMLSELFDLYRAQLGELSAAEDTAEPTGAPAFRDFVALERRSLASAAERDFWLRRLDERPDGALPRWPRRGAAGLTGGRLAISLGPDLSAELERTADALGAPVKTVLLAAHVQVLSWLTGSPDVVTGLVSNGRPEAAGADRVLGLFLNTLPFRVRVGPGSWRELVSRCRELELRILPHRRFPMAELQRLAGGEALFEATFNFVHFHALSEAAGDRRLRREDGFARTHFPLAATFGRHPGASEIELALAFDPSAFAAAQAERAVRSYRRALDAIARTPDAQASAEGFVSRAERHQLLLEWNDTARAWAPAARLEEMVRGQAARTPDAVALYGDGRSLSYRALVSRADRLAGRLVRDGVRPEDRVAILVGRRPELLVAVLAVLATGACYVPIDPAAPRSRSRSILGDAAPVRAVADAEHAGELPADLPVTRLETELDAPGEAEAPPPRTVSEPRAAAYVLYTSGSSGRPKGVVVSQGAAVNHMLWMQERLPLLLGDRLLQRTPVGFDASVWELFCPLLAGAHLVIAPADAQADPRRLRELLDRERITVLQMVPSLLRPLAETGLSRSGSLRRLCAGGETLDRALARRLCARRPDLELVNLYGPTEATIQATAAVFDPAREGETVPIGRPISNASALVVGRSGGAAAPGATGELLLGGDGLARGYLGDPARTAERFVPHPSPGRAGERVYRTGDLVRQGPDGVLEYVGRNDAQLKVRGVRVEPGEIEAVLRRHPDVEDAAVALFAGAGGGPLLVAYLVARAGARPAPAELRFFVGDRLPSAFVPSAFETLRELPRTASGKIDRRSLPPPAAIADGAVHGARAPRTTIELRLGEIWREVLAIESVDPGDDFFAVGGHSLAALRLVALVRDRLDRELTLEQVLRHPTLEAMGDLLRRGPAAGGADAEEGAQSDDLLPLSPSGTGTPVFWVHPVGGRTLCYARLARLLVPEVASIGVEAVARGSAPGSVREVAEQYLDRIERARPGGPWIVGGWSFGGWVAYETARLLEARGRDVEALVLIDSIPPPTAPVPVGPPLPRHEVVLRFARDLAGVAGVEMPDPGPVESRADELDRLLDEGRRLGVLPPGIERRELEAHVDRFAIHLEAARRFHGAPGVSARTLLLRASDNPVWRGPDADGWRRLCRGPLEHHEVSADHFTILREPAVRDVASRLARWIETNDTGGRRMAALEATTQIRLRSDR